MDRKVAQEYGNKVRVRACGLCWQNTKLLMVNHSGLTKGDFWAPPGGGVEFGARINDTLVREFKEETGLVIEPGKFLFGCEFIGHPLHSIELFYEVTAIGGKLITGSDPEVQIIEAVRFIEFAKLKTLPEVELHGIFKKVSAPSDLMSLRGFFHL